MYIKPPGSKEASWMTSSNLKPSNKTSNSHLQHKIKKLEFHSKKLESLIQKTNENWTTTNSDFDIMILVNQIEVLLIHSISSTITGTFMWTFPFFLRSACCWIWALARFYLLQSPSFMLLYPLLLLPWCLSMKFCLFFLITWVLRYISTVFLLLSLK